MKLVKALKAVSKKKADLEDELADEQDRGSKLEESVKGRRLKREWGCRRHP